MNQRIWIRILAGGALILLLAGCFLTWQLDRWVRSSLVRYLHEKTQFEVQIRDLQIGLREGVVTIHGMTLSNPSNFEEKGFLKFNLFKAHVDWLSLLSNRPAIYELVIDIEELAGVRNEQGQINISEFAQAFGGSVYPKHVLKGGAQKEPRRFMIQRLLFRLNQVTIADYKGGKRETRAARLGIVRVFNNVTGYEQVTLPLVADISVFVSSFVIDAILKSTQDSYYSKMLPKALAPIRNSIDRSQKQAQKLFNDLMPLQEGEQKSPQQP